MAVPIKGYTRKSTQVKAYKRKLKSGGYVMVNAAKRRTTAVRAHTSDERGTGKKKRNALGKMVYIKKPTLE